MKQPQHNRRSFLCTHSAQVIRSFHFFNLLSLQETNTEKLTAFINCLNGKEGTGSHLITVPPGPSLADALLSSPILAGEGGAGLGLGTSDFDFGVDPSADPELALVRDDQRWASMCCLFILLYYYRRCLRTPLDSEKDGAALKC